MATAWDVKRQIEYYARRFEPVVASQIMRAYQAVAGSMSTSQLLKLIGSASPERATITIMALEQLLPQLRPVGMLVTSEAVAAGKRATPFLPRGVQAILTNTTGARTFDVLNPHIVSELRALETRVVERLGEGLRKTFLQVMVDGTEAGLPHAQIARNLKGTVGLARNQWAAVHNFEDMLRNGNPEALTRAWRDHRFDRTLHRALGPGGTGLTENQIAQMTSAYQRRAIASNAATHARTAALDAQRLGQKLNWLDAIGQGALKESEVWKRWSSAGDDRVRPLHVDADGEEVRFNESFSVTGEDLPGEITFNCRCIAIFFRQPKRADWGPKEAGHLPLGHRVPEPNLGV